ncbi:hypothetical protein GNF10_19365 [Nostoc sp. UCD121]|uniref:hypothetical protein n=1 Tax=unclassified Nostoc TaxID=2593658 RepID=UPI0016283879|nr:MULTISPECIES: hypothetical protein [unclassified Nostoc]MBC1224554.1 hypothetical protein [Nostoc sp. UCD120]MBC1278060.1 hypothetical protein [Nostoc sp. UCD121]MBC1297881.1 hypothetical protein [Nostoc sp. UCD122]
MKTTTSSNSKTNKELVKSAQHIQQKSTFISEADYYDYEAELVQEKSDYYHLRYGY